MHQYYNNGYANGMMMPNAYGYSMGQMQNQNTMQGDTFDWVMSRAGAESYPLAPGRRAFLMENSGRTMYVKSTDISGRPNPLQAYNLSPVEEVAQALPPVETVDYDRINSMISSELHNQIDYEKLATMIAEKINQRKSDNRGGK